MHLKVYMSFPYKDPQLALCTVAPVSTCHRYSFTVHSSNKVNNNKVHCEHPYNSSRNNTLNAGISDLSNLTFIQRLKTPILIFSVIICTSNDFPETQYSKHSLVLVSTNVESAGLEQSTQQSKTYLCLVYLKEIC